MSIYIIRSLKDSWLIKEEVLWVVRTRWLGRCNLLDREGMEGLSRWVWLGDSCVWVSRRGCLTNIGSYNYAKRNIWVIYGNWCLYILKKSDAYLIYYVSFIYINHVNLHILTISLYNSKSNYLVIVELTGSMLTIFLWGSFCQVHSHIFSSIHESKIIINAFFLLGLCWGFYR